MLLTVGQDQCLHSSDAFLEPSDEEILPEDVAISSSDDEIEEEDDIDETSGISALAPSGTRSKKSRHPDEDSEESAALDEEAILNDWGTSRKDYYDADPIETEADALAEEAEARRLQQKSLKDLTEADFGLDEIDWERDEKREGEAGKRSRLGVVSESLPKLQISDEMSPEERSNILRTRYPEFEPLAKEYVELQAIHRELQSALDDLEGDIKSLDKESLQASKPRMSIHAIKYRALSAYLGAISMYFALLSSGLDSSNQRSSAMPPEELREHAVMETLLECRDLWNKTKDVELPDIAPITIAQDGKGERIPNAIKNGVEPVIVDAKKSPTSMTKTRLSRAEKAELAAKLKEKARRRAVLLKAEESVADLDALTKPGRRTTSGPNLDVTNNGHNSDSSDFGDPNYLTAHEAAEKAKRKKSLRFYTSEIAQKSRKRDEAGRGAGGDTDIPYKERLKDRQQRLTEQAERRGKQSVNNAIGEAVGEDDDNDEDVELTNLQRGMEQKHNRGEDAQAVDSDDYYDLVAKKAADKKRAKALQASTDTPRNPELDYENGNAIDADGKRGITYAIAKNKGLHQARKKDVRNPRVKKRKRFEDKKKKLNSMRPVYKSEREGKGGYGGERTGINRSLVKSVKL